MDLAEDGADLLASQHDRQVVRALGIDEIVQPRDFLQQDLAVQKEERAERLILRRCCNLSSTASDVRKRVISGAPISAGWRLS